MCKGASASQLDGYISRRPVRTRKASSCCGRRHGRSTNFAARAGSNRDTAGALRAAGAQARARLWIAERRSQGRTVAELADELGVAAATILRGSEGGVRALVPVRAVADPAPAAVSVVSPSGFRIEGLTLADAVRVLRELG
jgi:hypothetical protein